jgi:hypothetical protein
MNIHWAVSWTMSPFFHNFIGRFPVLSFAGLNLSQGVEFSLVMVSATFWWMFTRYYFELSIFWKFHLIWLIALCGWLIVTSQICCHCSYITKLKCSLWPKIVANVVTTVLQFLYSHLQKLSQWLQFPFRCFGEIRFQVSDTIKMEIDGVTFHMLWIHRKKCYLLNSIESKAFEKITSIHVIQCWPK